MTPVMVRTLLIAIVASATTLVGAGGAALAGPEYDCDELDTQEEAQAILDQTVGDPHRLDADDDGIACESLPSGGVPTGGVDAGLGGNAPDSDAPSWLLVGGGSLLIAAAGAAVLRRRTDENL